MSYKWNSLLFKLYLSKYVSGLLSTLLYDSVILPRDMERTQNCSHGKRNIVIALLPIYMFLSLPKRSSIETLKKWYHCERMEKTETATDKVWVSYHTIYFYNKINKMNTKCCFAAFILWQNPFPPSFSSLLRFLLYCFSLRYNAEWKTPSLPIDKSLRKKVWTPFLKQEDFISPKMLYKII